jgi:pyruvate formate lyase activating enzyme
MEFSGFQKTSLIDFPDRVASVLFTPGCNLRCPYCHNWRTAIDPQPPFLNDEVALRMLDERKRFVDAVVVSGGEPTIHKELPEFLERLKEKGFAVKLDTNGLNLHTLKESLPFLDYVALDVKTSLGKYERLGAKDTADLVRTIQTLKIGKVECEFRTTVVPGLVEEQDVLKIGALVKGAKNLALQQFVPNDVLDKTFNSLRPYSAQRIAAFAERLKRYAENVTIRI